MKVKFAVTTPARPLQHHPSVRVVYYVEETDEEGNVSGREVPGEVFSSQEMASAVLLDRGWRFEKHNSSYFPPALPQALVGINEPTATLSCGLADDPWRLNGTELDTHLHWARHPYMGRCYAFSFSDGTSPYAPPLGPTFPLNYIDPVLNVVFGGLVNIECIGYWLTKDDALQAAHDFYHSVREALGPQLFDLAVELCARREHERRKDRREASG